MELEVKVDGGSNREEDQNKENIPFVIFGTQDRPNTSRLVSKPKSFMREFSVREIPPLRISTSLQEVSLVVPAKDTELPRASTSNGLPGSLQTPNILPSNYQRPSIGVAESEATVQLTCDLDSWRVEEGKETSFCGIGKKSPHNAISDRFARFSSINRSPAAPRGHKPRVASWTANVTPADKIDKSVQQIAEFIRNLHQQSKLDYQAMLDLFVDASREIDYSWPSYHRDAPCESSSRQILCKRVVLIHETLTAYLAVPKDDALMKEAQELADQCIKFGEEWEISTGRDLGVAKALKDGKSQETAENNEIMEYIAPYPSTTVEEQSEEEDKASAPPRSKPRSKSLALQPSKHLPSSIPEEHHFSHNIISESIVRELQKIGQRFEMHTIMIQKIISLIVSDDSHSGPDSHTEKSAIAKRTDLLMLLESLADWKDDCGGKIDRIESGVNAIYNKEANVINSSMMESCDRIEAKLKTMESLLPTPRNDEFTQLTASLEAEKAKLTVQLEKLQIEYEERQTQTEAAKGEIQRLQGEVQGLEHGFRTVVFKLAELQSNAEVNSDPAGWIDEAWESAMDEFWPQGDPSVPEVDEVEREYGNGTETGASTTKSTRPQVKKSGRADESGTGTGACVIL